MRKCLLKFRLFPYNKAENTTKQRETKKQTKIGLDFILLLIRYIILHVDVHAYVNV